MVGGYFFVVMLITPKTTTATKLSNNITSLALIASPPFQEVNNLAASLDYMLIKFFKLFCPACLAGLFLFCSVWLG